MIIPANTEFIAVPSANLAEVGDASALRTAGCSSLVVEPEGRMAMPPCHVANRPAHDYRIYQPHYTQPDGNFPSVLDFPKMLLTRLENAFCLPHAPPFLPSSRQIVSDYLTPWSPHVLAWFNHVQENVYRPVWDFNIADADDIDAAFYLDHSISAHYGHFIGDCLSRMYAWDIGQSLYQDLKVIISDGAGADFQTYFINTMGVPDQKIVRIKGMVRCRQLLVATRSLNIHSYASPTSARLWGLIRDRCAVRDTSFPDRIYLSRSGIGRRRLANEGDVEKVFERHGFAIIRPEALPVKLQIALASNALLVAGAGGSGMFNLAFQGRMRSAFILRPDDFLQLPEMLLSAGRGVDLWFHLGNRLPGENPETSGDAWVVDMAAMQRDLADWLDHTGLA